MKTSKGDADGRQTNAGNVRDTGSAPEMPHERDESAGATGGLPSGAIQQAHKDVQRGLSDTDRGPAADRAYRKLKGNA